MRKQARLLLLLLISLMMACEPSLKATVKGGNPPIFHFYGDDTMDHFFVCPEGEESKRNEKNAIWLIAPDSEHKKNWPLDITYGVVPDGFVQSIPKADETPPTLEPNKKYTFHYVRGLGGGGGGFIIKDGKASNWLD